MIGGYLKHVLHEHGIIIFVPECYLNFPYDICKASSE